MARIDPVDLARAAYAAYSEVTGGLNYQGLPMPSWEDLSDTIQGAWAAAAIAVFRKAKPAADPSQIASPADRFASTGTEIHERIASDAFYDALGGRPPISED